MGTYAIRQNHSNLMGHHGLNQKSPGKRPELRLKQPLRLIKIKCEPHRKRTGHTGRGGPEQGECLLIATNLMDLPAEVVGLIFRQRWTVEEYQPHCTSSACFYRISA